jgi:acetyl esterase/lipase
VTAPSRWSGLISPVFADLSGLPPLIIQAGTHEVLLDDAIRLARQAEPFSSTISGGELR